MSWNYRLVRQTDTLGETTLAIHECFYSDDGEGWTENPVSVMAEDVDGVRWVLEQMAKALDRPIIDDTPPVKGE